MLQFILGTAQSGKTYEIIKRINILAEMGNKDILLIVPEQASFECERELIKALGVKKANKVNVLSFTRLCSMILSELGGLGARVADEQTRILMLSKALLSLQNDLKVYNKFCSTSFAARLIKDINELKQAAVTPEILMESSTRAASFGLTGKLWDISKIMSAYDSMLGAEFIDPEDITVLTARKANEAKWFKDKHIFVDGFTGFTHSQYLLIEAVLRCANETVFAFAADSEYEKGETELFANIKKEITRLKGIAKKCGSEIREPVILSESRAKSDELKALEKLLRGEKINPPVSAENIKAILCKTPDDEADYIANEICRAVRCEGKRWRDFVIITGEDANYEKKISRAMKKYDVPCFISENKILGDLPVARFVLAALKILQNGYKSEDVLSYLKSGLTNLSDEEVNTLEDYVYLWNISGKKWLSEWNMSPEGMDEGRLSDDIKAELLNSLNELRSKTVAPLEKLKNRLFGSGADMVKALFGFLQDCKTAESLRAYTERLNLDNQPSFSALQPISWDRLIAVLDRVAVCLSGTDMTLQKFTEILEASFSSEPVGEIPQRTDEVIFGTANRIRPLRPKAVFVMGANIGIFPAGISNSGIFTLRERNELQKIDISLPDRYLSAVIEQNYYFYTACCSASERVYFTYSESGGGAELKPSAQLSKLINSFGLKGEKTPFSKYSPDRCEIERSSPAFSYYAANSAAPSEITASIKAALCEDGEYKTKLCALEKGGTDFNNISSDSARKLYKENLYLSASKIEEFYSCPFKYFCKFGLGVKAKQRAAVDSRISGTLSHHILETVLKKYLDRYGEINSELALDEAKTAVKDYFEKKLKTPIEELDAPSRYAVNELSDIICELIVFIASDFSQNGFSPCAFELKLRDGEDVPAFRVKTDDGAALITGAIDRVDIADTEQGKAVRIVDYKSFGKNFKLSYLLEGKNIQMLLYLCAIIESNIEPFSGAIPAGVLYQTSLPGSYEGEFSPLPSVLLNKDTEILRKMDRDLLKSFIPVSLKKDGTPTAASPVIGVEDFEIIFKFIKKKIKDMSSALKSGVIAPDPYYLGGSSCDYCDYRAVCKREYSDILRESKYSSLKNGEVLEIMHKEVTENGN